MRELRTSGSVGGEGGNSLVYPTCARSSLGDWKEVETFSETSHWNPAGNQPRPASVPAAGTECCVA